MEMITMHHDRDGNLSMTHYLYAGNQPRMDLEGSSPGKMSFAFSEANGPTSPRACICAPWICPSSMPTTLSSGGPCSRGTVSLYLSRTCT